MRGVVDSNMYRIVFLPSAVRAVTRMTIEPGRNSTPSRGFPPTMHPDTRSSHDEQRNRARRDGERSADGHIKVAQLPTG
jgi:hypothetical protein